jgi:hypothetical protein
MVSTSIPHCFLRYLANIMRITMRWYVSEPESDVQSS